MATSNNIVEVLRASQLVMRREMDRRGIAMKAVSFDSGIPYSTLLSYFPGERNAVPAVMPVSAQYQLCDAIPDDILSLLLPDGRLIVRVCEGVDYDAISTLCRDFVDAKERAHHPESEDGRDIGPSERAELDGKIAVLRAA